MKNFLMALAASCFMASAAASDAAAQAYPSKPITLIVPSGTGGDADRLARALATYMAKETNTPFVVEDHPGAGQLIGHKYFLQQPADGYTFMITSALPFMATNIFLMHARFTLDDFDFIDNLWQDYAALYANKTKPWKTLSSVIDAIKAEPGKVSASVIFGSSGQVAVLAMLEALKLPSNAIRVVTFDGGGETKTAVAGGTVDLTGNQVNGMETIKDTVVPLGIFDDHRIASFDGPTVNEVLKAYNTSMPSISGSTRSFVSLPAMRKKYPERYEFIVAALQRTIARPDFQAFMKSQNMEANWVGPEKSKAQIFENFETWRKYAPLLAK